MNNKPVALKCIVKGCENHKNEGGFEDGMCLPCYLFITTGEGVYSQVYRNTKPADLTDEEIEELKNALKVCDYKYFGCYAFTDEQWDAFSVLNTHAKAILRKASEK